MVIHDDFAKDLADEVLSEMAGNFFGSRKQLDETIDLFHEYVADLRNKASLLEDRFRFLNFLLVTPIAVEAFYGLIETEADGTFPRERKLSVAVIPVHVPSAFSLKGRYVKLVLRAYDSLQKGCKAYNHGMDFREMKRTGFEKRDAYYDLVMGMHQLINKEIRRVNANVSPSQVLQTAKRFDPDVQQKEKFTGGGAYYGDDSALNRKLAFKTIDETSLNLKKFPDLPEEHQVEHRISTFCKRLYSQHPESIRQIVKEVENAIRENFG